MIKKIIFISVITFAFASCSSSQSTSSSNTGTSTTTTEKSTNVDSNKAPVSTPINQGVGRNAVKKQRIQQAAE